MKSDMHAYSNNFSQLRAFLVIFGFVLIASGGGLLLVLAQQVYLVMHSPESVPLVQFIMNSIHVETKAIFGNIVYPAQQQEAQFQIDMTESFRTLGFMFVGLSLLAIGANIIKVLITSGLEMIRLGSTMGSYAQKASSEETSA